MSRAEVRIEIRTAILAAYKARGWPISREEVSRLVDWAMGDPSRAVACYWMSIP